MDWQAVTGLSTAFTGLVIAVTAVAALREVRFAAEHAAATREQVDHLRRATQFEGTLAVFSELDTPLQLQARHFVMFELAKRLKDTKFRDEVALIGGADEQVHLELTVLRCFERLGFYVRKGFVDEDVVCLVASGRVVNTWLALQDVVAIHRSIAGPAWANFEQLYKDSLDWVRQRGMRVDNLMELQQRIRNAAADPAR